MKIETCGGRLDCGGAARRRRRRHQARQVGVHGHHPDAEHAATAAERADAGRRRHDGNPHELRDLNDPAAELSKPRGPAAAQSRCNVERIDRTVGTVSWVTACTTPEGVSRSEGTARYTADRVEADSRTRMTHQNGAPLEVSNHIVGRYLGPCDGK